MWSRYRTNGLLMDHCLIQLCEEDTFTDSAMRLWEGSLQPDWNMGCESLLTIMRSVCYEPVDSQLIDVARYPFTSSSHTCNRRQAALLLEKTNSTAHPLVVRHDTST